MKRDLSQLADTQFDLVIIGGGIYGAAAVWDAVLRGLKVALIERGDFGSATSSNSLKIIHGGLRYIQHADIKRMRESIRERRILMTIAPHLVHPLPCMMPLYGHLGKGPEVMRIAMMLNDLVGFDRNRIDDPQKILPNGKVISKEECLKILPGIREDNLSGGAIWYDCSVYNSERLIMSYLHSAVEKGALVANYVAARKLIIDNKKITGVEVEDRQTGDKFQISGRMILNTSGPWVDKVIKLLRPEQSNNEIKLSWAMNIVTKKLFTDYAAGVSGRIKLEENGQLVDKGSKVFFITPWRNYSLVGTVHKPYYGDPDQFKIKESFIENFIRDINTAIPGNKLKREDVYFYYGGLLPMDRPDPKTGEVVLSKQFKIIDHSEPDDIANMISVSGVKYTTARDVSVKAIDMVVEKLGTAKKATETDKVPIFGGDISRFADFKNKTLAEWKHRLPEPVINQLAMNYGSEYGRILKYGEKNPQCLQPVSNTNVLQGEIIHAIHEEMALHLVDVLWRRTEIGSAGNPGDQVLQEVARIMAAELKWDKAKVEDEIAGAKKVYSSNPG